MDSWSIEQQAKMRVGGNTAFREYMRACGMPERLQAGGGEYVGRESVAEGAIREKYHSKSAEAYKTWLVERARGEGPAAPPHVPYEPPPPPPNFNAPQPQHGASGRLGGSATSSNGSSPAVGKQMQGFGSQPYSSNEPDGLDALMASLGSGLGTARSALASAKSAAMPALGSAVDAVRSSETLGSVAERAKRAAAAARGKLEEATTFNAQRDLAHLSAAARGDSSPEQRTSLGVGNSNDSSQQGLGLSAVAGSMLSAGLGLWGRARAVVDEAVTFDASSDLAHLARSSRGGSGGESAAGGAFDGFGGFGGFGLDDTAGSVRELAGVARGRMRAAGAQSGGPRGDSTGSAKSAGDYSGDVTSPQAAPSSRVSGTSDSWGASAGDGWDGDDDHWGANGNGMGEDSFPVTVAVPAAGPVAAATQSTPQVIAPATNVSSTSGVQATSGDLSKADGWNDTSWADADDW